MTVRTAKGQKSLLSLGGSFISKNNNALRLVACLFLVWSVSLHAKQPLSHSAEVERILLLAIISLFNVLASIIHFNCLRVMLVWTLNSNSSLVIS